MASTSNIIQLLGKLSAKPKGADRSADMREVFGVRDKGDRPHPWQGELKPPTDYRWHTRAGFILIAAVFGGFGLWALFAPLSSAVTATGTVIVEGKRKSVQHLEGGIVKDIFVHDGSIVKAGDVLVELDGARADATLHLAKNAYDVDRAVVARLTAEQDGTTPTYPQDLVARESEPEIQDLISGQSRQYEERKRSLDGQIELFQQRVKEYESQIDGLRAQQESSATELKLNKEELAGLNDLYDEGYYPRARILAMQREIARLEGERGGTVAGIAQAEKGIGESKLQIVETRQKFMEDVVTQLRQAQDRVNEDEQKLKASQDVVDRLQIRASQSGEVQGLKVVTIGGVVQPGAELMQVIPLDERLIIDAQVKPDDISYLAVGQQAEVRFPALKTRTDLVFFGKLTWVSPDRYVDEHNPTASYYDARIEIPDEDANHHLGDHLLQPGMTAAAMIQTESRTPLQYLLKPLLESVSSAFRER